MNSFNHKNRGSNQPNERKCISVPPRLSFGYRWESERIVIVAAKAARVRAAFRRLEVR